MSTEIRKLRTKIDALDRRIVELLNRRLSTVARIGRIKQELGLKSYSASRTAEIMRNIAAANRGPHSAAQLRAIYERVVAASVQLQDQAAKRKRK